MGFETVLQNMKKQNLNNLPVRKSIRLKGWNYENPGFYFVTICTHQKRHLFGKIVDEEMYPSEVGKLAVEIWSLIPKQFPNARLDEFILMPNHIHGIIQLLDESSNFKNNFGEKSIDLLSIPERSPASTDAINLSSKSEQAISSTDAINRVRTGEDSARKGGITGSKNPMLSNGNLGKIMRWYKGRCTFEIRRKCNPGFGWHSRFYDHIIRNENSLI